MEQLVRSWGMVPRATTSSDTAMAWITQGESAGLAIVDCTMIANDGAPLSEQIRKAPGQQELPLIVYHPAGPRPEGAFSGKGEIHLSKPVTASTLFSAIAELRNVATAAEQSTRHKQSDDGPAELLPENLRILVAEDNPVNQKLAVRLLEKMGYAPVLASNGLEAVEAIELGEYDLVLMDVQMPEMDGLQATREIRVRQPVVGWPRIVAVTANVLAGDRELCLDAGMDDFLAKPIRVDELMRVWRETGALSMRASQ